MENNKSTTMFGGANSAATSENKLFTGATPFRVLGVNPDKEQIENWLGREYKLNVNYDRLELSGRMVKPYEVWLQDVNGVMDAVSLRFYIGLDDDVNQNGTIRFVNSRGVFSQSKGEEILRANPNMSWFTKDEFRVAKVGEQNLYAFLQTLMRYNNKDEKASFLADAEAAGITPESLYDGDGVDALHSFFAWCEGNGNVIGLLAAVRRTVKQSAEGDKTYYNQTVVNNPEYFSRSEGEISAYALKKLQTAVDNRDRISNALFTVHFQAFNEKECVNNVPDAVAISAAPTNLSSLLN